jgi:hypothetical protein
MLTFVQPELAGEMIDRLWRHDPLSFDVCPVARRHQTGRAPTAAGQQRSLVDARGAGNCSGPVLLGALAPKLPTGLVIVDLCGTPFDEAPVS